MLYAECSQRTCLYHSNYTSCKLLWSVDTDLFEFGQCPHSSCIHELRGSAAAPGVKVVCTQRIKCPHII